MRASVFEDFALRCKPKSFRSVEELADWIPTYLAAVNFASMDFICQSRQIVMIVAELRKFGSARYESRKWGNNPVRGLRLVNRDGEYILEAVRRKNSTIFKIADKAA